MRTYVKLQVGAQSLEISPQNIPAVIFLCPCIGLQSHCITVQMDLYQELVAQSTKRYPTVCLKHITLLTFALSSSTYPPNPQPPPKHSHPLTQKLKHTQFSSAQHQIHTQACKCTSLNSYIPAGLPHLVFGIWCLGLPLSVTLVPPVHPSCQGAGLSAIFITRQERDNDTHNRGGR